MLTMGHAILALGVSFLIAAVRLVFLRNRLCFRVRLNSAGRAHMLGPRSAALTPDGSGPLKVVHGWLLVGRGSGTRSHGA